MASEVCYWDRWSLWLCNAPFDGDRIVVRRMGGKRWCLRLVGSGRVEVRRRSCRMVRIVGVDVEEGGLDNPHISAATLKIVPGTLTNDLPPNQENAASPNWLIRIRRPNHYVYNLVDFATIAI